MPPRKRKPRRHPNPPRDLAKRELPLHISQDPWLRIHRLGLDAIFFGTSGDNRFDAPGGEFGFLYVAQDMFGAFVETLGYKTGTRLIALAERWSRQGIIPTHDSPSQKATIVMHEPLLERIRILERAVQRWRLVCVALSLLFVSSLAINGAFGFVMILSGSNRQALGG